MSDKTFQFIIGGSVVLALLSMIVQGFAALALYRSGRKMATRLSPILARVKAILAVEKDSIRRMEIVIDKTMVCVDILERLGPRFGSLAARTEAIADRAKQLGAPVNELGRSAKLVGSSTHCVAVEAGARLESTAAEVSALVRSASTESSRIGRVFHDAFAHVSHLRELIVSK